MRKEEDNNDHISSSNNNNFLSFFLSFLFCCQAHHQVNGSFLSAGGRGDNGHLSNGVPLYVYTSSRKSGTRQKKKKKNHLIVSSFLRCCVKWSRRSSSLSFSFLSPYWQYIYDYDVYRCAFYIVVSPALCAHNSTNVLHNGESVHVLQRYYTGQGVTKKKKKTIHHRGFEAQVKEATADRNSFLLFHTPLLLLHIRPCCISHSVTTHISRVGETRNLKPK